MTMSKRITDEDLKMRHAVMHAMLAALGYISDDASIATAMEVQRRFDDAVANGRMALNGRGHYTVTREYYDRQVRRTIAWSRSKNRKP
jgi:hypothetical protein